jgi:tetratricopeptide (TPR) repeat protein
VAQPAAKDLLERQPKLLAAIQEEIKYLEDKFQAQVCLGWLHWVAGEYDVAATRLPTDQSYIHLESLGPVRDWTKVCALKAAYLKANCLTRSGLRTEALARFDSALRTLNGIWASNPNKKQLRYWGELFLTEYCMLFSQTLDEHPEILTDPNCLACFRSWAKYWDSQGVAVSGGSLFPGSVPRRRIWLAYYDVISEILKQDLPYPTGYAPLNNESSARTQLRMELKKVEAKYEALLLNETTFPRAEERREEVERFVELVVENWKILTGRGWRDHDLGQGGKESLSRGVLDILYRAATKTFHSTAILRYLFTVHLAVAEFDLAFKAFDSYLDLIKQGKARVEKTGEPEPSLDDDETVLETVSTCILALCRYGDRRAAEKARTLAGELEHMLEKLREPGSIQEEGPSPGADNAPQTALQVAVDPAALALCWQSMGLAHAQWARVTYDSASRTDIQKKAIQCLRKSLSSEFGRSADIRGVFALGLLLAEQRELAVAIELVKTALLAEKAPDAEHDLYHGPYWRERSLVPLWHLLSLMLSARQDYVMAARACEGAFEQFKDPSVLFGTKSLNGGYRSDHLNEVAEAKVAEETTGGVVDDMDDYEKESILEVKMTQLAIVELLEGPKVAVNASIELLSLYSRLFGVPQPKASIEPPKTRNAPKSSAGTLRSIKGSIFGSRGERQSRTRQSIVPSEKTLTVPLRPQTTQTTYTAENIGVPISQVGSESGTLAESPRRSRKSASATRGGEYGSRRASLRKRETSGSTRRAVSSGAVSHQRSPVDGESYFTPSEDTSSSHHDFFQAASKRFPSGGQRSMALSDPHASNGSARNSRAADPIAGISVAKLEPHHALLPVIQFSADYHTRRRTAVLVEVWLMTAGLYRRAGMYDDAEGATAEAKKLVQGLEAEVASDATGALSLSLKNAGWAGKKSVEELWADFWAEVSDNVNARFGEVIY